MSVTNGYCTLAQLKERILDSRTYTTTTLSFAASTKKITDSKYGLKRFATNAVLQVSGTTSNNNVLTVVTGGVAHEIVVAETLTDETPASATITDISDPPDDAILESVINAVSRWIDVYTGRRFYAMSETRYYTAEFPDVLMVDDLLSITQLACDISGARSYDQIWDTSDYDLEPYNAQLESVPRPYTRIRRTMYSKYVFPIGLRVQAIYKTGIWKGVRIIGSFGYSTTPPPQITEATLLQCARVFKRKDAVFGVMGSADMGTLQVIPKFDPDIALMLQPFIKMRVGAI